MAALQFTSTSTSTSPAKTRQLKMRKKPALLQLFTVKRLLALLLLNIIIHNATSAQALELGSKCQHDMDCTDFIKGSSCSTQGYCECAPYFVQFNATSCLSSQLLGGDCMLSEQCTMKVANSSCLDGACRCVEGFLQFRKHTCLGPAHPGAVCYSHAHCQMFEKRTHCDFLIPNLFGRCQCTAPARMVGGLCVAPETAATPEVEQPIEKVEPVTSTTTTTTTTPEPTTARTTTSSTAPTTTSTTTTTTTTTPAPQQDELPASIEEQTLEEDDSDNLKLTPLQVSDLENGEKLEAIDLAHEETELTHQQEHEIQEVEPQSTDSATTGSQQLLTPADVATEALPEQETEGVPTEDYPYKIDEEYTEEHETKHEAESDVIAQEGGIEPVAIEDEELEASGGQEIAPQSIDNTMKFDYETAQDEHDEQQQPQEPQQPQLATDPDLEKVEGAEAAVVEPQNIVETETMPEISGTIEQDEEHAGDVQATTQIAEQQHLQLEDEQEEELEAAGAQAAVDELIPVHDGDDKLKLEAEIESVTNVPETEPQIVEKLDNAGEQVEVEPTEAAVEVVEAVEPEDAEEQSGDHEAPLEAEEEEEEEAAEETQQVPQSDVTTTTISNAAEVATAAAVAANDGKTTAEDEIKSEPAVAIIDEPTRLPSESADAATDQAEQAAVEKDDHEILEETNDAEETYPATEATNEQENANENTETEIDQAEQSADIKPTSGEDDLNEVNQLNQEAVEQTQEETPAKEQQSEEQRPTEESVKLDEEMPVAATEPPQATEVVQQVEEGEAEMPIKETAAAATAAEEQPTTVEENPQSLIEHNEEEDVEEEAADDQEESAVPITEAAPIAADADADADVAEPELTYPTNDDELAPQIDDQQLAADDVDEEAATEEATPATVDEQQEISNANAEVVEQAEIAAAATTTEQAAIQKVDDVENDDNDEAATQNANAIKTPEVSETIAEPPAIAAAAAAAAAEEEQVNGTETEKETVLENEEEPITEKIESAETALESEQHNEEQLEDDLFKNEIDNIIQGAEPEPSLEQQTEPINQLAAENETPESQVVAEEQPIQQDNTQQEALDTNEEHPAEVEQQAIVEEAPATESDYTSLEDFTHPEEEKKQSAEIAEEQDQETATTAKVESEAEQEAEVTAAPAAEQSAVEPVAIVSEEADKEEDFKESQSIADILSDLIEEADSTVPPVPFGEQPVATLPLFANTENDGQMPGIPDLFAEEAQPVEIAERIDASVAEENDETLAQETVEPQENGTPAPQDNEQNTETTQEESEGQRDEEEATETIPNENDKLITFYPEMFDPISETEQEQKISQAISEGQAEPEVETVEATTVLAAADVESEPERTLSPEELPFDLSDHSNTIRLQELESDNLILESTTLDTLLDGNNHIESETAAPAQPQLPNEEATPNPAGIVEITTQTMLGLASRVTLMEPAAPVVTTLKPFMGLDDATPEPAKETSSTQSLVTTKPSTEQRKRVELGLEAISLGLPCASDRQCQLADPHTVCNRRGVCDCAESGNQCNAERTGCSPGTFQCRSSGVCISWFFVCDGRADCNDNSDEECTHNARFNQTCPAESFRCERSGRCISRAALCDGRKQCPHGEDELGCNGGTKSVSCPPHTFRCNSGECLPEYEYCNAIVSCKDGSDEPPHLCGSRSMPQLFRRLIEAGGLLGSSKDAGAYCPHRCSNGLCRSTAIVCSGRDGCGDGTDEQTCAVCRCPAPTAASLPAYLARHRPMPLW
ncbi:titin [Scaptodrosophila lebanonensis]|uniref:Titin n=1 Tax=Drosophila lebanonensis TaxID=7225 RepID=A0A6J2TBI7_DROLE|nr:titin [Scaptodrosophila lebanonensis]